MSIYDDTTNFNWVHDWGSRTFDNQFKEAHGRIHLLMGKWKVLGSYEGIGIFFKTPSPGWGAPFDNMYYFILRLGNNFHFYLHLCFTLLKSGFYLIIKIIITSRNLIVNFQYYIIYCKFNDILLWILFESILFTVSICHLYWLWGWAVGCLSIWVMFKCAGSKSKQFLSTCRIHWMM